MTADKLKQYIAFIGGMLGALYLFAQTVGVQFEWLNDASINSFVVLLNSLIPLVLIGYGIYKNQYLVTQKAKTQEKVLERNGLK